MASAEPVEHVCIPVKDKILKLEHKKDRCAPNYIALAVLPLDKLILIDSADQELHLHCLKCGLLLTKFNNLLSSPSDICRFVVQRGENKVAVALNNGQVQILSVDSLAIIPDKILDLREEFATCIGVKALKSGNDLLVSGFKDGWFYWSTVSIANAHVNTVHKICEGKEWVSLATSPDEDIVYISCLAGLGSPNNGVYAFHINTGNDKFVYKSSKLDYPSGISVNKTGFIYVCNYSSGIHQLTEKGELVTIHLVGEPYGLYGIDWDEEQQYFYITYLDKNEVIRFRNEQGTVIPVEILRMDDKSRQLYERALQDGKEKIYNIRVMVVGQYGVGKTTLTKRLLGQSVDITESKHTEGIDVHNHRCRISLDTGEWIIQHEAALYKRALQDGKEKIYNIRVMVVGQYGVEKTTLIKRLLGQSVDITERKHIEGIDVYNHRCRISLVTGEWIIQHEDSNQLSQLQRLAKFLAGKTESAEITTVKKAHGENKDINQQSNSKDDFVSKCVDDGKADISQSDIHQPQMSSFVEAENSLQAQGPSDASLKIEKPKSSKGDATSEILQLVKTNAHKLIQSKLEHAELAIWDFAGQHAFYTTHQTFLTHRAIYILVTDLSQQITDIVKDDQCYFDTEGLQLCKVQDLVDIWLNSIHSCTPSTTAVSPITFPAFSLASPDIGVSPTPPVIIVGTHVDKIRKEERQEVINRYVQQICCMLKDKPTLQHLVNFVPIDNTQIDPQLEVLKTLIFQLASKQIYWGEEVPVKWIILEEELRKLKASNKKVITRKELENIIDEQSVPIEKSEELDLFLRFLHETGTIIYFSIEVLRAHIVLEPKLLIDALKCLINAQHNPPENLADISPQSVSPVDSNFDSAITKRLSEFKQKGILTSELLDDVWIEETNPDLHVHRDHILLIMEHLSIIAKPLSFNATGQKEENFFLTPCMLRLESPREVISPEQDPQVVSTPVLSCVFTGKFLPPAVFHRLLAACVARWPVAKKKETSENLIFCGCCVFDLDLFHRLTLHIKSHTVFVRITRLVDDEVKCPDAKLCSRVRRFITKDLTKITSYLGQNLQYELHVCPPFEMWLADEGHAPDAAIKREHMNHARLCVALVTICGKAMREILLINVPAPYNDIYQVILANQVNLSRRLNKHQFQLVFPDPQGQKTGTVEQFDISLLYTLIRNISSVLAPTTGWGNEPQFQPRDHSLGASVERIRLYRNYIGGHSPDVETSDQDFEDCWNNITLVINNIEDVFGRIVYSPELEKQKRQVISVYEDC